jgi:hypothetical protein
MHGFDALYCMSVCAASPRPFPRFEHTAAPLRMSLANSIRTSLLGLLVQEHKPTDSSLLDQSEGIRQAMISVLGDDAKIEHPVLLRRIRYAEDIQALWFLRSDLMAALSSLYGERRAHDVMAHLNDMFRGYMADAKAIGNTKYSAPKR